MKLKYKFGISITVMVLFVIAGVSLFLIISERSILWKIEKDKETSRIELAKNLVHVCKESIIGNDHLLIINHVRNIKNNNEEIIFVSYVNKSGEIRAHTDPKKIGQIELRLTKYDFKGNMPLILDNSEEKDVWEIILPVIIGNERAGTTELRFSQVQLNKLLEETKKGTYARIAGISGVSLLLGLFGSFILAGMMSSPIKKLSKGAQEIGEGNLDTVIRIRSRDELGDLAKEFNEMAVKLKELDNMKEAFVSNITHDLKSPLGAMKGYVDFLLKGKMGNINEKQHDALLRISENAVRLGSFISDILDYTRIKSGRVDLIKENIDMAKVIKETVRLIEPLAEKKLIILGTQVPDSPVEFMGDEKNLERVLHNLISNAIKFTPEKGQITIALEDKKKELIVSVSDNGVGIPPEDIDSIFERFHQVKDHVKLVQTRGTGLGLAIVKGIVDAHGGKVWVESKLNKGSTFYFSLPKDTSSRELAPSASVVSLKYLDI